MKDTIKQSVIRLLEEKGEASKTQICDHIRELHGTTGDCCARRMREMVSAGILIKEKKEYADKTYFAYRVAKVEIPIIGTLNSKTEEVKFQNPLL